MCMLTVNRFRMVPGVFLKQLSIAFACNADEGHALTSVGVSVGTSPTNLKEIVSRSVPGLVSPIVLTRM